MWIKRCVPLANWLSRHHNICQRSHLGKFPQLYRSVVNTTERKPSVCIVGSGPAGFYTAQYLLKFHERLTVDIYDKLPVPFGLVRFGVAPDHPETKNCINQFTATGQQQRCRFVGNVNIGQDLSFNELKSAYDVIILCYGAENDKVFGIPGEDAHGVYSARNFVEWYNGLPSSNNLNPDLSSETVVVLGQGNVALDIARILLKPISMLEKTDICEHALDTLRKSKVKQVYVVGRRGPLQISFTIKELREMTKLPGCRPVFPPEDFQPIREKISEIPRQKKRLFELLCNTALNTQPTPENSTNLKEFQLMFCRSPVEILSSNSKVSGIKFEVNKLVETSDGFVKAEGTGETEIINCGLIFRSIGYRSVPIDDGIPFDHERGVVSCSTNNGHVTGQPGVYCCGWVRTGPTGVILSTLNEGRETAKVVVNDLKEGKIPCSQLEKNGFSVVEDILQSRGVKAVTFSEWERIDLFEQENGKSKGKPREKIVNIETMLKIAHS